MDTKEDKDKVITSYKENLSRKDCKYFKQGRGVCPFGNKCFYMHAYPGGQKVDVGPPKSLRTIIEIPREFELIQVTHMNFLCEIIGGNNILNYDIICIQPR